MSMYYDTDSSILVGHPDPVGEEGPKGPEHESLSTIDEVSDEEWQLALELMISDCLATAAEYAVNCNDERGVVFLRCNCGDGTYENVTIDWLDTHDELKEKVAKIRMAGWYVEDVATAGVVYYDNLLHFLRSLGDAGGELDEDEYGDLRYQPNIEVKRRADYVREY